MVWMKLPMNKQFALAFAALLCFASQGYARHPFVYDPISEAPSVLVKSDAVAVAAPIAAAVPADSAVMPQPETAPVMVEADVIESGAAPMPADGTVVESGPAMMTESAPVYRSRTYRKSSGGVVSELNQIERRKNSWIRRNIFGR